ncbi:Na+/alanine symporter [Elusimicrobium simillimum]
MFAANLCNSAFKNIPYVGTPLLIFSLATFSFTTILGWCYYGEKVLQFLEGDKWITPFRIVWLITMVFGAGLGTAFTLDLFVADGLAKVVESNASTRFMWAATICAMAFMTVINIYAIIKLRHEIKEDTEKYIKADVLDK